MDKLLRVKEKSALYTDNKEIIKMKEKKSVKLYVTHAEYAGDIKLNISFSDGTSRIVDFKPFLLSHPHPQYNRYTKPENFKKFSIEFGNVVWGKNWDLIFPIEQLYSGKLQ